MLMELPPALLLSVALPLALRLPGRSLRNSRRRTSTSLCVRIIMGRDSPSSFWRPGCRLAGQLAWSPLVPIFPRRYSLWVLLPGQPFTFGGIEPGDFRKVLIYNKDRTFAFVMPMGYVTDEWYANAAGAVNWGFPTIADTPIPEILPTGICSYEHVVSNIPHDKIVAKAIEVRGLKVTVAEVPIPIAYGPAFEGERVRGGDIYLECGGGRSHMVEWVTSKRMEEVDDGKIDVIGSEITDVSADSKLPMAIAVEVAGRMMQEDYEPILERQIHHLINYAQGVMHIGQRDIAWLRVSKQAVEKGFRYTISVPSSMQSFIRISVVYLIKCR